MAFGATVRLQDEESGKEVTYQIVGEDEADVKLGLINIGSPIARALIGKSEGDTADVQAPGGVRQYEVGGGQLRLRVKERLPFGLLPFGGGVPPQSDVSSFPCSLPTCQHRPWPARWQPNYSQRKPGSPWHVGCCC